jgi:hypothetical protein
VSAWRGIPTPSLSQWHWNWQRFERCPFNLIYFPGVPRLADVLVVSVWLAALMCRAVGRAGSAKMGFGLD